MRPVRSASLRTGLALLLAASLAPADSAAPPAGEAIRAVATARPWLERGDAAALESELVADREHAPQILRGAGDTFATRPERRHAIATLVAQTFWRHLERLRIEGPATWLADEPRLLLALAIFDPARYAGDATFRDLVDATSPLERLRAIPAPLRDAVVEELGAEPAAAFDLVERLGVALRAARRASRDRERADSSALGRCDEGSADPIAASLFVLPSEDFFRADVTRFLRSIVTLEPDRAVLVVTDSSMQRAIAADPGLARVRFVPSLGRDYSPWPRDPLLFCQRPDGGIDLLARPDRQPGRELDSELARTVVQGLPEDLDRAWGRVRWSRAPTPFHNGQVLFADGSAWMSIHSVERLNLDRLGLEQVPKADFRTAEGIARYTEATRESAADLARLYGAAPRFVHPLAAAGSPLAASSALMRDLGGGAGFDLDSLLTVLPSGFGRASRALVADISLAPGLLASASIADLGQMHEAYGFLPAVAALRDVLARAQQSERARRLDAFLDLVAAHLASDGLHVSRLPLLLVPAALVRDGEQSTLPDFLLTWNNVVLERRRGMLRAEGFASGLPLGDTTAMETFARAGCDLHLLPLLPRSVIRNGGYRCASNHLRRPIR